MGRRTTVATVIMTVALTGCSGGGGDPASSAPVFAHAIEEARAGGASQAQIDLLERLAKKGAVELDDVREALAGTYECLDAAGISHSEVIQENRGGFPMITYTMSQTADMDVDTAMRLSDQCALTHSAFVEQLYATQPQAVAAEEAYIEDVIVPRLDACNERWGMPTDTELSAVQRWDEAIRLVNDQQGVRPGDPSYAGCVYEALLLAP
jgi:hypothetical protein